MHGIALELQHDGRERERSVSRHKPHVVSRGSSRLHEVKAALVFDESAKEYPLPKAKHQQQLLWQKYDTKIAKAVTDKYSQKTLTLFDFTLYIKSQILNVPIKKLLETTE